jgi:hypothetical protein
MTSMSAADEFPPAPQWRRRHKPRSVKARARRLAEILAECSAGILPGDYSEAGISDFLPNFSSFITRPPKPRASRARQASAK